MKGYRIVGLTGAVGSGKSEIGKVFETLGSAVIDLDQLAWEAIRPGTPALEKIKEAFGTEIMNTDNSVNKMVLGEVVYNNPAQLKILEDIVHPEVRRLGSEKLALALSSPQPRLVVYVLPLSFEGEGGFALFEKIIAVDTTPENCIDRIMIRDGCKRELAVKKLASQPSADSILKRADYVIKNNSELSGLHVAVTNLYQQLAL